MFQAQEQAKEDGLRRVEASRTDADLGTLLATCPEWRLFGQVLSVPCSMSALAVMHQMTPTGPAPSLLKGESRGIHGRVCFRGSRWQGEVERRATPVVAVDPNPAAL